MIYASTPTTGNRAGAVVSDLYVSHISRSNYSRRVIHHHLRSPPGSLQLRADALPLQASITHHTAQRTGSPMVIISHSDDVDAAIFMDTCEALGLYQHIAFPTHKSGNININQSVQQHNSCEITQRPIHFRPCIGHSST